ncbi:hypothetical protein ATK30_6612 [Amycolatopsis echigonensis]|uniref:Uncharacterized protein n=1 Tax=Amycolatopsis echigonensis TaxID=2576905 RepID=A0A2N3WP78_9PSEU|nr:hypothetical protein [Amycolatopsis niigatensis]PKV95684.1 hypothetical protein ATK30_6612 [Amycolatopsis niigatensis]
MTVLLALVRLAVFRRALHARREWNIPADDRERLMLARYPRPPKNAPPRDQEK